MTIVLVGNTKSGRGLGKKLFDRFCSRLEDLGEITVPITLNDPSFPEHAQFDPERFRGARAILAFGGDGTVNAVADAAIRTNTPVYHVPAGNENLIARRYGMNRNPDTFLRALSNHHTIRSDVGVAEGRRFLIMATIGPDARVIERLHMGRTKALGHLAYLVPVLKEAASPYLPSLTVTVDGRRVVDNRRGWLIVANDREYAARLNFAASAGPTTRSLTAVFLPANNVRDCTYWVLRAWARRHTADPRMLTAVGSKITIESPRPGLLFQLDGEHDPHIAKRLANGSSDRSSLEFSLDQETLPILVPDPKRV